MGEKMAKMKKQALGKISGALGDIVFRNRKNTNYVATRPINYNIPQDIESINRRIKFSYTSNFVSVVNSVPELRVIWESYTPAEMLPHNYIFKSIYTRVNVDTPNAYTHILPDETIYIPVEEPNVSNDRVEIITDIIGNNSGIDPNMEKQVVVAAVISLNSPVDNQLNRYHLISLKSSVVNLNLDNPMRFQLDLNLRLIELLSQYNAKFLLYVIITLDAMGNPVNFTRTYFKEL